MFSTLIEVESPYSQFILMNSREKTQEGKYKF